MIPAQSQQGESTTNPLTERDGFSVRPTQMTLSVVMAVYNERAFIEEILRRIQAVGLEEEIVVVEDGSKDGTRELLQELQRQQAAGLVEGEILGGRAKLRLDKIRFLFQEKNQGKGAALRRGFAVALGDILLVQDADLEYDPKDYSKMLEPILGPSLQRKPSATPGSDARPAKRKRKLGETPGGPRQPGGLAAAPL